MSDLVIFNQQSIAGTYYLGGRMGLGIHLPKRPRWIHRLFMRWCLGFEWEDAR